MLDPVNFEPHEILVPPLTLPDGAASEFEALWQRHSGGTGGWIDYSLRFPKSLFLRWLVENEGYLLHGTGNDSIETFEPRTQTDVAQRSLRAVFAASDGIWPMYFAITNRAGRRGSLRNGCERAADGSRIYYFSINASWFETDPWSDGVVYVLPSEGFHRCTEPDGTCTEEWVNESAVTPIARLRVAPTDFPFLERVTGHDDTEIFAFADAMEAAVKSAERVTRLEDEWLLEFTPTAECVDELADLCRLAWRSIVIADLTVALECRSSEGPVRMRVTRSTVVDAAISEWRDGVEVGP